VDRISLCVIARDEERMLRDCLASAAGAVDELVVVDTGSSDGTREVARAAGARVLELPWADDFSAPRNEAARAATGGFLLQLDADERLLPGAAQALRAAVRAPGVDAWTLRLHNAARLDAAPEAVRQGRERLGPAVSLPRLVRRAPDLEWRGIVHESISDWLAGRGMRLGRAEADILHLGYADELRVARGKEGRNLALLRRRCALEPDNVTPFGYLALELIAAGDTGEAAHVVEAGWALVPRQPADRSLLRIAVARGQVTLREERPEAVLEAVDAGLRRDGSQPDLHHLAGQALALWAARDGPERQARLSRAGRAFEQALAFEGADGLRQYVAGSSSHASWNGLGGVRLAEGRHAEALRCFERALLGRPGDRDARLGIGEVTVRRGDAQGALVVLESLLDDRPDGWLLAALAARALGAHRDAEEMLRRASDRLGRGFVAPHRALYLGPARETTLRFGRSP
jgi:tetratricopeptide (TPR) repeat protein